MKYRVALALTLPIISAQALADAPREVQYGGAPDWVLPAPKPTESSGSTDAAFRIVYQDTQERIRAGVLDSYNAYRIKVLKPEALSLGNVNLAWSPSAGVATVHYVRIIRDGSVIDVLKQAKFRVLEREAGLEQSVLDGNLTAALQVPGLQVGDEIEFAGTIAQAEPAFGTHAAGIALLPSGGFPGAFRYRLIWPEGKALTWRTSKDLVATAAGAAGRFKALQIELRDPPASVDVEGAPPRYNLHRTVEYSDYSGWDDLSKQMWPLFQKASELQPDSPIRAEAAKIAAASTDPVQRAQAALRLVQDQIRYVFVGLDGGNYIPATADETWRRRFGDCKAKTAVLLALLRELGIKAEPVIVNSKGGDGTNERLPNPTLFNHVLVRATVNGSAYWLDGTRLGDRYLDVLPPPSSQWGLPLTPSGAALISIPPATSLYPQTIDVVDIDASAGFDKEAVWTVKSVVHGDEAFAIRTKLSTMSPADAERAVKAYWRQRMSDIDAQQASWSYDERHATMVLSLKGQGKVDWQGSDKDGHTLTILGAGFYKPDKMERPRDQDQTAAWAVEYPYFRCWATTIHLPAPTNGFHWTYSSRSINRRLAGKIFWRAAGLKGNVVRTVMSRQSYSRELSAAEAKQENIKIPSFDNYMSSVDETPGSAAVPVSALPFAEEPDWSANPAVCSPESK